MKKIIKSLYGLFVVILLQFYGCKEALNVHPIISETGKHIGDSILVYDKLSKIVFSDSSYYIDSIVFYRNVKGSHELKSMRTFMNGKNVFENIFYYPDGEIKTYLFIDDSNENYFFKREYDESGRITNEEGKLFFQGYIDKINPKTLEVKDDNKRMEIKIFYPNPPFDIPFLYVGMDNQKADVFKQNKNIPFLKQVWVDTKKGQKLWSEINVCLELNGKNNDTLFYSRPIYYKVVK